jgi:hypothetical protein
MRITIEPSAGADKWDIPQHTVVVDSPSDECDLDEVLELMTYALQAYGFVLVGGLVERE